MPIEATGLAMEVASLASLTVLKLVAWLDRPLEREKDLDDFMHALRYALPQDADCRWDTDHPVGASGLDVDGQSAFFVGLEVGGVIGDRHEQLIGQFLAAALDDESPCFGRLARAYRAYPDAAAKTMAALHAFCQGLKGT